MFGKASFNEHQSPDAPVCAAHCCLSGDGQQCAAQTAAARTSSRELALAS